MSTIHGITQAFLSLASGYFLKVKVGWTKTYPPEAFMLKSKTTRLLSAQTTDQLITWVRQAGYIALRYFRHTTPQFKPDQTLVTQADMEIEQFLVEQLRAAFPGHGLLAEEKNRGELDWSRPNWLIDPLDGTTVFTQGLPGWGISIGLLYQGQPYFGLFYMPLLDDLMYTTAQGEVYRNEYRLQQTVRPTWGTKDFLAIGASVHQDFQLTVPRLRALGSVGASLVYTARGAAAATLIPKAHLWDLVAGAAILKQAGGELRYLSGQRLNYWELADGRLAPEPVIAGHPDVLAQLPARIRRLGEVEKGDYLDSYMSGHSN